MCSIDASYMPLYPKQIDWYIFRVDLLIATATMHPFKCIQVYGSMHSETIIKRLLFPRFPSVCRC